MRILAIDPGQKNIGIALSDETATIATPLTIIKHIKREIDAAQIAAIAAENDAKLIIVGQSLDEEGKPTFEGRRSARFAKALRAQTEIPVKFWDESYSTQDARQAYINMGVSRKKRRGHLDDVAAAVILKSYLESN